VNINDLKIKYNNFVHNLSVDEYETLKDSIQHKGLKLPIIVNKEGIILDGHHRFSVCKELGIEPKIEIKTFDTIYNEKRFVIYANTTRRHLLHHQKAALALELKKIEDDEAKDKLRQIGKESKNKFSTTNQPTRDNSTEVPKNLGNPVEDQQKSDTKPREEKKTRKENEARQRAAKRFHISDEYLRQYEYIVLKNKTDYPDIADLVEKGLMKVGKAYETIQYLKVQEE
jgi:ParB-like chromosome segregation protein Spo0J